MLVSILVLAIVGIMLVIVLFRINKPLLSMVLSLQRRVDYLEAHPAFYSQTIEGLNNRVDYLQRKCDEQQYELRVIHSNRDQLLVKLQVAEEQNQLLSNSLRALKS